MYNNFTEFDLPENERWENLTLANDFMFCKVFEDLDLCLELVQTILPELNIARIAFNEPQKPVKETFDTRGVRFDIYLRDDSNRIIDVEIQTVNRDNIPRRTRAYHSMIDLDAMERKSVKIYDDIPDSIVIFICCFDLFNKGRHIYPFRNLCESDSTLQLGDGARTIILNTRGELDDVSPKLKAFLNLINGKSSNDSFVVRLEERLQYARQNKNWRQNYMLTKFEKNFERNLNIKEGREIGLQEGREIGIQEGMKEGRRDMLEQAINFMRTLGATPEQIEYFRNSQGVI
ncbi:MAG: Rpn family recombination-promoting nuclease/putative transposase [Synergistaceae bacterium]|nr:Rpn family recombination-promoting nuclease/putative transposase [Synergistaceae bacterium]